MPYNRNKPLSARVRTNRATPANWGQPLADHLEATGDEIPGPDEIRAKTGRGRQDDPVRLRPGAKVPERYLGVVIRPWHTEQEVDEVKRNRQKAREEREQKARSSMRGVAQAERASKNPVRRAPTGLEGLAVLSARPVQIQGEVEDLA